MSLSDLQPINTLKAKATAVKVFTRFLGEENVKMDVVADVVRNDASGAILISLVDRFGVYLACHDTKGGKKLARHTVMQYFRQSKAWLLEQFPQASAHVEKALLKKGNLLERYCIKRSSGVLVKQANACSKEDLFLPMSYLYANATSPADYQDVALLSCMWYLFGRASDLTMLQKEGLSLCGGRVLFVRFVRMKTSEEQGLSLFPDACVATCPLTALAVALTLQATPNTMLLPHLPAATATDDQLLGPLVPLADVLAGHTAHRSLLAEGQEDVEPEAPTPAAK